jgi:hypothetical protein
MYYDLKLQGGGIHRFKEHLAKWPGYSVLLQPYCTDVRDDQGILVVNIYFTCQFPPQVSRVGQRHHLSFSADPICAGPRPAATLPLDTTSALYDDPLPAVFEVSQTS